MQMPVLDPRGEGQQALRCLFVAVSADLALPRLRGAFDVPVLCGCRLSLVFDLGDLRISKWQVKMDGACL